MRQSSASAPGNVFLFGEHAVVYGTPAVVAAVDLRTFAKVGSRNDDNVTVNSEHFGSFNSTIQELLTLPCSSSVSSFSDPLDPIKYLIRDLVTRKYQETLPNCSNHGFDMVISSQIPKESGGLSSSTAVLSAALAALASHFDVVLKPEEFFDWLHPIQVAIHGGKASGAEILSSSVGGYHKVRIDNTEQKPKLVSATLGKKPFYLVIGDTQVEAATKSTVPYVKEGWERCPKAYNDVFDRISQITLAGEIALMSGDATEVGRLMNENHEILARELGISHPKLNRLVDAAREAGAKGAKLSGGGKGGIMIALVSSEERDSEISQSTTTTTTTTFPKNDDMVTKKIVDAVEKAGGKAIVVRVGGPGVLFL